MADIRIKDLATTAASTASDDFLAVDGSANGTRKLNAYSPTFGGNLTVSGTGNSSVAGNLGIGETSPAVPLHVKTTGTGTGDFDNAIATLRSTAAGRTITLQFSDTTNQSYISSKSGALNFGVGGATLGMSLSSGGNLTVSGTGTSSVAGALSVAELLSAKSGHFTGSTAPTTGAGVEVQYFSGIGKVISYDRSLSAWKPLQIDASYIALGSNNGNVLIGTTTDSANGKLQLATHTTSAGGIGFGTDSWLYRDSAGLLTMGSAGNAVLKVDGAAGSVQGMIIAKGGSEVARISVIASGSSLVIATTASVLPALTLDSSQNATFAGNIKTAAPSGGTAATWRLGTVATVSPTSPNRTIEVEIGGTTYYIHAKTTNN